MKRLNQKRGFGLLEVLLAGVIVITLLSSLMVVSRNVSDSSVITQQRTQATYLAQEGIELVRQVRDSNYIDQRNYSKWDTLIGDNSTDSVFIIKNGKVETRSDNYKFVISKKFINERYRIVQQVSGEEDRDGVIEIDGTTFTRTVTFEKFYGTLNQDSVGALYDDGKEVTDIPAVKVKVVVEWMSKSVSNNRKIEMEELITNFRQGY